MKNKKPLLIESVEHLKQLLNEHEQIECFIKLGMCRSSKNLFLIDENTVSIFNEIDDSEDTVTFEELENCINTNVGIAIRKKAFFLYPFYVEN